MGQIEQLPASSTEAKIVDLSERILATVRSILEPDRSTAEEDFKHLLRRVKDLFNRRQSLTAPGGETKDMLVEVLYGRVLRGFKSYYQNAEIEGDPQKAAVFLLGSVLTGAALAEFAHVLDCVLMQEGAPKDFHLAGRADFISMDELLQLLASGKHTGRLALHSPHSVLDLYFKNGLIAFVDPHSFNQRLIQTEGRLSKWREIPQDVLNRANERRATENIPVLLGLRDLGFFKDEELRFHLRNIGIELVYNHLQEGKRCAFSYEAMEELPDFVEGNLCSIPVMPLLLEGHKRIDEWRRIRRVFPNLDDAIQPTGDMFQAIAELPLDVIAIKALTLVTGANSFRDIADATGLNNFDLGMMLVGFARQGILVPPGGKDSLFDENVSSEEAMQAASDALDAAEAFESIPETLNSVLGTEEASFGLGFTKAARDLES